MTDREHDKNAILRRGLARLSTRIPQSAWRDAEHPHEALRAECLVLASDATFRAELKAYVGARTILKRSISSFYTAISMAARAKWQDVEPEHRAVAARGWFLGRWIPTFLVIDGPIGRFFLTDTSPLTRRSQNGFPVLSAARTLLGDKTFLSLRNGIAHWGFDWEVVDGDSYIVAYDWNRDLPIAKLHQEEADAFHICAYAFIEVVDDVLISGRAFERGTG